MAFNSVTSNCLVTPCVTCSRAPKNPKPAGTFTRSADPNLNTSTWWPRKRVINSQFTLRQSGTGRMDDMGEALKRFRLAEARKIDKPAFHIFTNKELDLMMSRPPRTMEELFAIPGFGKFKCQTYGPGILALTSRAATESYDVVQPPSSRAIPSNKRVEPPSAVEPCAGITPSMAYQQSELVQLMQMGFPQ